MEKSYDIIVIGGGPAGIMAAIKAAENGMAIIHISTELRFAFASALKYELIKNPDEVAPYKIMKAPRDAMQAQAEARLKLFNRLI